MLSRDSYPLICVTKKIFFFYIQIPITSGVGKKITNLSYMTTFSSANPKCISVPGTDIYLCPFGSDVSPKQQWTYNEWVQERRGTLQSLGTLDLQLASHGHFGLVGSLVYWLPNELMHPCSAKIEKKKKKELFQHLDRPSKIERIK